ncbi:MAG: DNA processing protein DprA, partial [Solirubrobacterales bacterium]
LMLGPGVAEVRRKGPPLEPDLAAALRSLDHSHGSSDSLAAELGLSAAATAVALAHLELLGYVECSPLGRYSRTLLQPPS